MSDNSTINSKNYWDNRFSADREALDGPRHSHFFARLAMENFPVWLIEQVRSKTLTVADWGCAQGDGTNALREYIGQGHLTGIDFSEAAIHQAAARYPSIRFLAENWLTEQHAPTEIFDIVFSSNTLEYFQNPWDVLDTLTLRAKKAVALMLPYREVERIDQHFYSFLPENIPLQLKNGFSLVWSKVVDCKHQPQAPRNNDQILLIYAENSWIDYLQLSLIDCTIEQVNTVPTLSNLHQEIATREEKIAALEKTVTERDAQIIQLHREASIQGAQLTELNARLIQISDWADRISKRPIRYGLQKSALTMARSTLRAMPLSVASKQRLRDAFFSLIRPLRNHTQHQQSDTQPALRGTLRDTHAAQPAILQRLQKAFMEDERDVFVFAVIDWHFRIQRPQHIARSLAAGGRRVFYFSNHFVDADAPGYQLEQLPGADALFQIKLHVKGAPAIYFDAPSDEAMAMLKLSIAQVIQDFGALSSLSIMQHAYWYPLVALLPNTYRIYDCMDHHEGFGDVPEKLMAIEKHMLGSADLVTVTSSWLEDFARTNNTNVAMVRNAGEYTHFCERPAQVYADSKERKIIGYYGAIAKWFDLDLLRATALAHPDCLVLLVGNDTVNAQKQLHDLPNVEFTGEVPYDRLPYYLYAFDVCLLPFQVIPLTLATNPVKVYEYLAAGKSVVCVDLPEIAQFGDLVACAPTPEAFVTSVSAALRESGEEAAQKATARRSFACEQTWEHRGEELLQGLASIQMPRVSVIILTFNNLDLTRACLDSVLKRSDYPNLEVIVVDNASTDDTPAYLKEFGERHPEVRIVLNDENLGFAAGNNVGLSIATGDYLVVLNNDTVVTPGWVLSLLRHFERAPALGLLGPVTGNIGNEARIKISYPDLDHMPVAALDYTLAHMGERYPLRNAAFFCVIMPRSTYERCGPISEDYGLGFFEDDDYCRMVETHGLTIACADDVFVHHHLSASFNKMNHEKRQALVDRNKAIYEKKWGKWVPHVYRP